MKICPTCGRQKGLHSNYSWGLHMAAYRNHIKRFQEVERDRAIGRPGALGRILRSLASLIVR